MRVGPAVEWLEDRTGVPSAFRRFLQEQIPASAGWPHVFGSVALFLFFTQALTGILLTFNYAPTPGEAYHSVVYIVRGIPAGRMVQGLHHWGASAMVIVVFLHMAQVFIYGAYRKPREATWIAGVALLLFVLAFGLTGYLLPWDNRAYWGTMVTTRIMTSAPLAGPILTRLAGTTRGIGLVTFARFYSMHTLVLPAMTVALIGLHVYLVRRHGVTPTPGDTGPMQAFYPRQLHKDMAAVFIAFTLLFAAAAFLQVPLERMADPTDSSYVPRPEWYFLFLFQLLKIFQGALEPIGTIVLPTAAVLILLLLPFLGKPLLWHLQRRLTSAAVVVVALSIWAGLTIAAVRGTPARKSTVAQAAEEMEWAQFAPEEIAGAGYFRGARCGSCHNLLTGSPKAGPNLAAATTHHPKEWLAQHFIRESPAMPRLQLNALSLFLSNLRPDSVSAFEAMSPGFIRGAQIYVAAECASCHKVNGGGGGIGPPLNGLSNRRTRAWVEEHFVAPHRLSPGSIMPPYRFPEKEREAITSYLLTLSN